MRDVKGSTSEEVRMIRAIQRSVGALDNGWIGNQTLSDIAAKLGADCWPAQRRAVRTALYPRAGH